MRLRLTWENKEDISSIGFRCEIRTSTNLQLGTFFIDEIYRNGKKGQQATVDVTFNISQLVPGTYRTAYTFFYKNEYGDCGNVDCVRGLGFEIIAGNDKSNVKWDAQNWGYVELEPPVSIEVKE